MGPSYSQKRGEYIYIYIYIIYNIYYGGGLKGRARPMGNHASDQERSHRK